MGIDIGDTFTNVVLLDVGSGTFRSHKELTTASEPAAGVAAALRALFARDVVAPQNVCRVVHATTPFTNALIERKGALTGLITTQGFRDVLEIGREQKRELYDILIELPRPLIAQDLRLEVSERFGPDGEVIGPLSAGDHLILRTRAGGGYGNPDFSR